MYNFNLPFVKCKNVLCNVIPIPITIVIINPHTRRLFAKKLPIKKERIPRLIRSNKINMIFNAKKFFRSLRTHGRVFRKIIKIDKMGNTFFAQRKALND